MKKLFLALAFNLPLAVMAAEPSLCIKDGNIAFCVESDTPMRIVPYREQKNSTFIYGLGIYPGSVPLHDDNICPGAKLCPLENGFYLNPASKP